MAKKTHLTYFSALVLLMIFTMIITSTLVMSLAKINMVLSFVLFVLYGLFTGYVSLKVIAKVTHKDKKEILAGSIIPLPTVASLLVYMLVLSKVRLVDVLDPLWASVAFFVSFNVPFLILFYEHEKHKHHLVGFLFAPLVLTLVYVSTFFVTSFVAADYVKPQLIDSLTLSYEIVPVKEYIESCMEGVTKDALGNGVGVKERFDANFLICIDDFNAFEDVLISSGGFTSEVVHGDSTTTVKLDYPIVINKEKVQYKMNEFVINVERS